MATALLIEDDPALRDALRRMLQSVIEHVIEAADGAAGMLQFLAHKPDLVITDIMMPNQDGIETLREILSVAPDARVIAMSGGGTSKYPDPLALAQRLGARAVLEKPVRRAKLLAAVSQLLAD